jgi:hypothetical protein
MAAFLDQASILCKILIGRSMNLLLKILLFFLLLSSNSYALTEIGGNFAYEKQVYGATKQNSIVSRTYAANIALYFLEYTALELNFSNNEEITTETNEIAYAGSTISVVGIQNRVEYQVYGVGLKQAFAGRKAFIIPSISLGYAKQFIRDNTDITFRDTATGLDTIVSGDLSKRRVDSAFATFALKISLTSTLFLQGSVKTVFPAKSFDKAKDNLKYLVGFSWYF